MQDRSDQRMIDRLQQEWIEGWCKRLNPALHIGCGEKYIAGAVNIDRSDKDSRIKPDFYIDVNEIARIFPPDYFACAVSNHVVPSFPNTIATFTEIHRILGPGGIMAHVIPDLRFAPQRTDQSRNDYQPHGWRGPDDFRQQVMDAMADLFRVIQLESFAEFDWSFKVVAEKICVDTLMDSVA